jgi:hypothetical protein
MEFEGQIQNTGACSKARAVHCAVPGPNNLAAGQADHFTGIRLPNFRFGAYRFDTLDQAS